MPATDAAAIARRAPEVTTSGLSPTKATATTAVTTTNKNSITASTSLTSPSRRRASLTATTAVGGVKRVRITEAQPIDSTDDVTATSGSSSSSSTVPISDQERSDSWWSASDFATVKDSVKRQCRDHRQNRRYSDCLTDAYRSACTMAARVDAGLTTECESMAVTLPDEGLARWLTEEGPRGLEVYSSRLHALRRQRHLQDTKHAVFLEQARQNISQEFDDESLARQAAHASRRARTFATLLGHADAWAAGVSHAATTTTSSSEEDANAARSATTTSRTISDELSDDNKVDPTLNEVTDDSEEFAPE